MQRYVAFLRGINLGKRRLPMSRLAGLFGELGFSDVSTFIASGNVLFSTRKTDRKGLELRIAQHLESGLGYPVDTFLRSAEEVNAIAASRLFSEDGCPGVTIYVGFMHVAFPPESARKLTAIRTEHDEFRVAGTEYYWLCRVRSSESEVWTLPSMKAIQFPSATVRNMNTVRKLVAKHLADRP